MTDRIPYPPPFQDHLATLAQARPILDQTDYINEDQVLARWPMLTRTELRRARKCNPPQIEFYDFPKRAGGPCCTAAQVQEYIDRVYLKANPCPSQTKDDSRSGTTISTVPIPSVAASSTPAGMTPELAQHAAEALARQMSKRRRSSSPRSSPQPRKPVKAGHLKVVKS